ncbi:unnamed protein product, partial [Nesidiocoris tenuis]
MMTCPADTVRFSIAKMTFFNVSSSSSARTGTFERMERNFLTSASALGWTSVGDMSLRGSNDGPHTVFLLLGDILGGDLCSSSSKWLLQKITHDASSRKIYEMPRISSSLHLCRVFNNLPFPDPE